MQQILDYQVLETLLTKKNYLLYRCIKEETQSTVIVKVLNEEYPSEPQLKQFQQEFELFKRLAKVPGVLTVKSLVSFQNTLAMVFEDVNGYTLASGIDSPQKTSFKNKLSIAIAAASTIAEFHQRGLIHKNITPEHIIWQPFEQKAYITDLTLATDVRQESPNFQHIKALKGHLAYISPEQTGRINTHLDSRTDLYSFGVVLYQLFTGRVPFDAYDDNGIVHAHIAQMPKSPEAISPIIPDVLAKLILKLLEKHPENRYQTVQGVLFDLQICLDQHENSGDIRDFELAERDISTQFRVSHKLYGRDIQRHEILQKFENASKGNKELMMISGYAGSGKSILVKELHAPITAKNGIFLEAKFEQYQSDLPYISWIKIIEQYVEHIMAGDKNEFSYWVKKITNDVGAFASILCHQIPALTHIFGHVDKPIELTGEQALNRFKYAVYSFFKSICNLDQPLVLFIDDWQWADSASISLLQFLMTEQDALCLLVIGAYRENEVDSMHSLKLAIDELKRRDVPLSEMTLQNLSKEQVTALIIDSFNNPTLEESVITLIYEKTQGNPFFIVQLLESLYLEGAISYHLASKKWQLHYADVNKFTTSNDVVELLCYKLNRLSVCSLNVIKLASCIGHVFDVKTLSAITDIDLKVLHQSLDEVIKTGTIKPILAHDMGVSTSEKQADFSYQFIHDKVQQAAYGLLTEDEKQKAHEQVAQTLLSTLTDEQIEEKVFEVVNHLNVLPKKQDPEWQLKYFKLNVLAGQCAKNITAFQPAMNYFTIALKALPHDYWQSEKHAAIELFLAAAESAFLCKHYQQMDDWLAQVSSHITDKITRVRIIIIQLQAYTAQNRLDEAVSSAIEALKLLNMNLNHAPKDLTVMFNLLKTKFSIQRYTIDELSQHENIQSQERLLATKVLGLTIPPAYWTSPNLVFLIVFLLTRISVKEGYHPLAGFSYSWWGIVECAVLGNIDKGYQYGKFGIELAEAHDDPVHQSLFYWGWMIKNYRHHIADSIEDLNKALRLSLEAGDFEYASFALNNKLQAQFHAGQTLTQLLPEMAQAHKDLDIFNYTASKNWHAIWWQVALNFVGYDEQPTKLEGLGYKESEKVPEHIADNDASALFLHFTAKLMLGVYFHQYEQAIQFAERAKQYAKAGAGMFALSLFHFYHALACLSFANERRGRDNKQLSQRANASLNVLEKLAKYAPENHCHRCDLIKAELFRVKGDSYQASVHYNDACNRSRQQNFTHECALAWEKAALFYAHNDQEELAEFHLRQSYYFYGKWGATAKLEHLGDTFQSLLTKSPLINDYVIDTTRVVDPSDKPDELDLASIIKASKAISKEIVFDELLKTLLKITMENAGAQRGTLFFNDNKQMGAIKGALIANDELSYFVPQMDGSDFALSVFSHAINIDKTVVIGNAQSDALTQKDTYVLNQQCKSIACMPIHHQGKLIAALYLENNLIEDLFSDSRIEMLNLLSSQAAISIVNAHHYSVLEQQVKERTAEIALKNEQLSRANEAKSDFLTKVGDELRTPINSVIGLSRLTLAQELPTESKSNLEEVLTSSETLLDLVNDILDFSQIEAGKLDIESVSFSLEEAVQQVIDEHKARAKEKGLKLLSVIDAELPSYVVGDPVRIKQVLNYFVSNAVKFTDSGEITINVFAGNKSSENLMLLKFEVVDTGVGLSQRQQQGLFQPFLQVDHSINRQSSNTGLGLAISKHLAELMGGDVWVHSELGVGSTFGFSIRI